MGWRREVSPPSRARPNTRLNAPHHHRLALFLPVGSCTPPNPPLPPPPPAPPPGAPTPARTAPAPPAAPQSARSAHRKSLCRSEAPPETPPPPPCPDRKSVVEGK